MTIQDKPNDLLLLGGKVVALILQGLIALGAVLVALTLPIVTIFANTDLAKGFADGSEIPVADVPILPLVGMLGIALAILVAMFFFFGKLRAIIDTVGQGDPFAPANAERLNLMAWLLLATQLLTWPLVAFALQFAQWADELEGVSLEAQLDAGLDLTGILTVLILFILARVFRHGATMRDDLEGTV